MVMVKARMKRTVRAGRNLLRRRWRGVWLGVAALALALGFACVWPGRSRQLRPPRAVDVREYVPLLATGYCNCGTCCGWRRNWWHFGRAEYAYGPQKGMRKIVGRTAAGTTARHGTIAADPKVFPFGTRLWIPGYGEGVVEDVGGAIKGRHIDLWFPTHAAARVWGSQELVAAVLKEGAWRAAPEGKDRFLTRWP